MNDKFYNVIISSMAADMLISHARFITNVSGKATTQFIEEFNKN